MIQRRFVQENFIFAPLPLDVPNEALKESSNRIHCWRKPITYFFFQFHPLISQRPFLELKSLKRDLNQESFNILYFSINHLVENKKDSCGNIQIWLIVMIIMMNLYLYKRDSNDHALFSSRTNAHVKFNILDSKREDNTTNAE